MLIADAVAAVATAEADMAKLASCRIVFEDGVGVIFGNKRGSCWACCSATDDDCSIDDVDVGVLSCVVPEDSSSESEVAM